MRETEEERTFIPHVAENSPFIVLPSCCSTRFFPADWRSARYVRVNCCAPGMCRGLGSSESALETFNFSCPLRDFKSFSMPGRETLMRRFACVALFSNRSVEGKSSGNKGRVGSPRSYPWCVV
jgi:hypothetical protein